MIDREAAVQAVEEQLERDCHKWRTAGVDAMRMAVVDVEEHELVWIVSWQSEEFVRTRDSELMLVGNGPYLVDRVDGGLHRIGVVSAATGEWEADYRARIRGLPVRTAVDDLHDALRGVAATRGHLHAVRTLRQRLPVLSPAEAVDYVSALLDGEAPARLVAVAVEELVEPLDPVRAVKKKSMAGIAAEALARGPRDPHPLGLGHGPVAADLWTDGDLGFVLLLHRRDDGFVASELYYSLKGADGRWTEAEHLSGEFVGFDPNDPASAEAVLSGAAMTVLSESESRVFTGGADDEDGGELIRLYELLVSEAVDSLRIEKHGPGPHGGPTVVHKTLTTRGALVAVRPGQRLRVVPVERSGLPAATTHDGVELFCADEPTGP
ncbi:YrhB domain-containing protein [Streptomyces sp. NPDC059894]|uniref:YrhB domain-containing protein n=1 Tax=unclassified Streptomyces TaxID=2593676 RepID=UPI0036464F3F